MKRYEIKRFLLSSVLTLGVSSLLLAQSGTVAGRVTDTDTGDPLVGANVTVMGTNLGAATDINGEYSIGNVPAGAQRLKADYIGYGSTTMEVDVPADGSANAAFSLAVAALNLNEVVVTGTGTAVEKSKVGNSVGVVDMEALEDAPITNMTDILQGREKGVVMLPNG